MSKSAVAADLSMFAETDRTTLAAGFKLSQSLTFTGRTRETHGADWSRAAIGMMDPAEMIADRPDREDLTAFRREDAHRLVL